MNKNYFTIRKNLLGLGIIITTPFGSYDHDLAFTEMEHRLQVSKNWNEGGYHNDTSRIPSIVTQF